MLIPAIHSWGKMSTGLETWDQSPKYHQHQGLRTGEAPSTVFDFAHLSSQTSQKHRTGIWGWQIVNTSNSLTKHGARCQPHTPTLITLLGKENRLHTSSFWRNRGCEERHPLPAPWFSYGRSALMPTLPTQSWLEGRDNACPAQGRAAQGARLRAKMQFCNTWRLSHRGISMEIPLLPRGFLSLSFRQGEATRWSTPPPKPSSL